MNAVTFVQRLNQHRQWTNARVLDAVDNLTHDQLRQTFSIGQGSILRSVFHLFGAEYVWFQTLQGEDNAVAPGDVRGQLPGNQSGEGGMQTIGEVRLQWQALDLRWNDYFASVTAEDLAGTVYRISTSSGLGKRHGSTRADVIMHVSLHAQYTIAQINNMLRQLGITPTIDPMMITLARQEYAASL